MAEIDFKELAKPFSANDIEWRLQSCGGTGKAWGKCLAYITNRAIQQRLDDVCGPENWKNEYATGPNGGILCGISIKVNGEWITKWDGAENTQVEAVKGGLSDSMKRSAVQWSMGRYLYKLDEGWAETSSNDKPSKEYPFMGKTKEGMKFTWRPPKLPDWALPEEEREKSASKNSQPTLSPEAERERNAEMANSPEYIQLKDELTPFLNAPFIAKDSRDNIRDAIDNYKVTYMKKILSWCNSEREKAAKAAS